MNAIKPSFGCLCVSPTAEKTGVLWGLLNRFNWMQVLYCLDNISPNYPKSMPVYNDINNRQHTGVYIQSKLDYSTASGFYSPYIRWTWIDDSDKVNGYSAGRPGLFYEPMNRRLQIGVEWKYWR
jgi:hypothetical protein